MPKSSEARVAKRWKQMMRRFQRSRLTVLEFCRREGVSTAAFYHWKRRLKKSELLDTETPPAAASEESSADSMGPSALFAPLNVSSNQTGDAREARIEIQLPNGVLLQVPAHADDRIVDRSVQLATGLAHLPPQTASPQQE